MATVRVGSSLSSDMELWRYMSIDKFIDLISNKQLFLTPLCWYESRDPYEGNIPKVAQEMLMSIEASSSRHLHEKIDYLIEQITNECGGELGTKDIAALEKIQDVKSQLELKEQESYDFYKKICKSVCVNCWYRSDSESEGMWRLYSDNNEKGIAIKTSVSSLVNAIKSGNQSVNLSLSSVKYINFSDSTLNLSDCMSDGAISPLMKRREYSHENEVRLYTTPQDINYSNWRSYEPKAITLTVDVNTLIEEIYISPYAVEPFISSVHTLCEIFGVDRDRVTVSRLLSSV